MKCPNCGYDWVSRKERPVSCPRCKRRFDYPSQAPPTGEPTSPSRSDSLAWLLDTPKGFERTVRLMAELGPDLEKANVRAVVVGGSAVEFYTRNWYATSDVDLAINREGLESLGSVLSAKGFKKIGRMWVREDMGLYIEAPGDIFDISQERITEVQSDRGSALFIGVEDIIADRLAAAKHWKSEKDRQQALRLIAIFNKSIDWPYLQKKARDENFADVLKKAREDAAREKDTA